jgi:hypothetical protein
MLGAYPVVPLAKGQAVSIGLTSYDGGVYFGLNADRDAMTDVDVLAECLEGALQELLDTVPGRRRSRSNLTRAEKRAVAEKPAPVKAAKATPSAPAKPTAVPTTPTAPSDEEPPSTPSVTPSVRPKQVSSSASRGLVTRGGGQIRSQPIVRHPSSADSD